MSEEKVEASDYVELIVVLNNSAPVISALMPREQASGFVRQWWNARTWSLLPETVASPTGEEADRCRKDSTEWLRDGTVALNLIRKDGGGDWCQAAWAVSMVVAMYTREILIK
jgi:hypothetical protein